MGRLYLAGSEEKGINVKVKTSIRWDFERRKFYSQNEGLLNLYKSFYRNRCLSEKNYVVFIKIFSRKSHKNFSSRIRNFCYSSKKGRTVTVLAGFDRFSLRRFLLFAKLTGWRRLNW